ncbi:DUF6252 family protein [Flavobacterium psychrotolerans]|uniref:Uncharacterized protein n=1 Tax=Flavobacterium psychrotolerans TaxID=2169410 RepID=A0A2U1JN61_9FLAO|nr:DUF6252 family protein [Flavobacterium psychrotolerans]PWA06600.1 hypothetical protein DB895_04080 [Flavobacterium psychrotolerans]
MKKINFILLVIISQLMVNCSNNNDPNPVTPPPNNPTLSMKIDDVEYKGEGAVSLNWKKKTKDDGTHYYVISIFYNKVIGAPNGYTDLGGFNIKTENIEANQVFQLSSANILNVTFSRPEGLSNTISLYANDLASTGQLKITSFDGSKMSGEFSFNNLRYLFSTSTRINVTNGVFTNIPISQY